MFIRDEKEKRGRMAALKHLADMMDKKTFEKKSSYEDQDEKPYVEEDSPEAAEKFSNRHGEQVEWKKGNEDDDFLPHDDRRKIEELYHKYCK